MSFAQKTVRVITLGCKVNTFDSQAIAHQFQAQGFLLSDVDAAITVVNSCSVTANADKEARYLARRIKREHPGTKLVFTGCYAQTDSQRLIEMDEVDLVIPNEIKEQLVDIIVANNTTAKIPANIKAVDQNHQGHFKTSATLFDQAYSTRTRAYLKIQDGCNGFCTYCLIPYARGASRSVDAEKIIAEVKRLNAAEVPEIVLTGIHLGDYGEDLPGSGSFADLLEEIFATTEIPRVRISSLEPSEVKEKLLQVLSKYRARFCEHMHLPLQSGSDSILKKMRRQYDKKEYLQNIRQLRGLFPLMNFGADIIPGFPGETEEEFNETLEFIEECGLHSLHVFPYSKRPNTAAARMPGHLDQGLVNKRAKILRDLSTKLSRNYSGQFIGQELQVLWEDSEKQNIGHARNYLKVEGVGDRSLFQRGVESSVRIKGFSASGNLVGVK